jgi:hypothetical protein
METPIKLIEAEEPAEITNRFKDMTTDEIYHEVSEEQALDRLTSQIDHYEMLRKEGEL